MCLTGDHAAQFGLEDGSYVLASAISDHEILAELAAARGPSNQVQGPGAVKAELDEGLKLQLQDHEQLQLQLHMAAVEAQAQHPMGPRPGEGWVKQEPGV